MEPQRKYLIRRAVICFVLALLFAWGAWRMRRAGGPPGLFAILALIAFGGTLWHFPPTRGPIQVHVRRMQRRGLLRGPMGKLPEAGLFPDEESLVTALHDVEKATRGTWMVGIVTGLTYAFSSWLAWSLSSAVSWCPRAVREAVWWGLVGSCGGGGVLLVQWLYSRRRQHLLRERLLALGVPVCLKCGYDLRALTEPRCPECGAAFDPKLLAANSTPART